MKYGSVCSGIEAASIAWEPLGWKPVWFAEIEAFPSAVLQSHWPEVTNLGDMTKIADAVRAGDVEAPDALVGGTPCQAFSIAGLREGLSDDRGQLTLSYVELANAIDAKRRERGEPESIIVWENVPGVLSSKDNAFGCFLAGLAGESSELQPAGGKWTHAGCVSGPQRVIAWRVLDAQFFGVAQRRRRVFVIASARTGFDPAAVLFEFDSVRRDTPPRREARKVTSATTGSGVKIGSHWDNPTNPHPTLNQSHNIGGIGQSNQALFSQRGCGLVCIGLDEEQNAAHELFGTLKAREKGGGFEGAVAYSEQRAFRMTAFGEYADDETASTCKARDYKDATDLAVTYPLSVRRLTPIECERLQGFPDNHTLIGWRGKDAPECPDGPRYKAIGNSMAVPVMRWIGEQLQKAAPKMEELEVKKSPYVCALEILRAKPEHELKEVGDQWRTPDLLFWGINALFGPLVLDLFADDSNAKCPAWYTAEDNALTQNWSERVVELGGAAFGNPPYSRSQYDGKQAITGMTHIMNHTMAMRELGGRYVFLIKAATSETWWPEEADHVAFIRGRIGFDLPTWFVPLDDKQQPSGAFFAGAVAVFDKSWRGERFSYINRTELEAKGRAFMALAQFAVGKTPAPEEEAQPPVTQTSPIIEDVIYPLEVRMLFDALPDAEELDPAKQAEVKNHIKIRWLERATREDILAECAAMIGAKAA
ncbi:phage N-6-adenine-methyltransferase [Enterobacter sp. RHB15-C17]|nr:phage N-6-adenine-methyltransferase [Enterobacter sp. RHB15-C17]